tara:strand:- start:336 stop:473 length:138 start_codon:yes stop_codon:yes gene_type:complete
MMREIRELEVPLRELVVHVQPETYCVTQTSKEWELEEYGWNGNEE